MEETKVKDEPTEDDYVYERAPSPEAPVYELIPLQDIPPNELAGSDVKIKQETFKKMRPDCQKDVPSMSSCVSNTRNGSLFQDKATQCTDDYLKSLNFKTVKDASTETSTLFEGFYYKSYLGMCACNKPLKHPSEIGTAQTHGSEFLMNFSPSQGTSSEI